LKTTNPVYKYSYIKNILKEQNNQNKRYYIENNITLGWKRCVISKNYLTDFKAIPSVHEYIFLYNNYYNKNNNVSLNL